MVRLYKCVFCGELKESGETNFLAHLFTQNVYCGTITVCQECQRKKRVHVKTLKKWIGFRRGLSLAEWTWICGKLGLKPPPPI